MIVNMIRMSAGIEHDAIPTHVLLMYISRNEAENIGVWHLNRLWATNGIGKTRKRFDEFGVLRSVVRFCFDLWTNEKDLWIIPLPLICEIGIRKAQRQVTSSATQELMLNLMQMFIRFGEPKAVPHLAYAPDGGNSKHPI